MGRCGEISDRGVEMEYATIWKQGKGCGGGYLVEWRKTFILSEQQEPTKAKWFATRSEAKQAVEQSGAILWN